MKNLCLLLLSLVGSFHNFAQTNLAWAEEFGNSGITNGSVLALDAAGNSYMGGVYPASGITLGSIALSGSGGENSFVVKSDPNGVPLWATRFQKVGGFQDVSNPEKLAVDAAGYVYVAGVTSPGAMIGTMPIPGDYGYYIARLDLDGTPQWIRRIESPDNINAATIAIYVHDDEVFVAGLYNSAVTFGAGNILFNTVNDSLADAFLAHYDTAGNFVSAAELGAINPMPFDVNGGYTDEYFRMSSQGSLFRLAKNGNIIKKYSLDGSLLLTKTIAVTGNLAFGDLTVDHLENIFLCGHYQGSASLEGETFAGNGTNTQTVFTKLDAAGTLIWNRAPGNGMYYRMKTDAIGNLYLSGGEATQTSLIRLMMVKYDAAGSLMWDQSIFAHNPASTVFGEATPSNIALDNSGGNILFMGYYKNYIRLSDTEIFTSNSSTGRIFLAQYGTCSHNDAPEISASATSLCTGDSLVLTATPAQQYYWSTGETTAQITVTAGGDYFVSSITDVECFAQSDIVHIDELALPDATVSLGQDGTSLTTDTTAVAYQWTDCGTGVPIAGATGPVYIPVTNGSYSVTVTNAEGCSAVSDCFDFDALAMDELSLAGPMILSPNPVTNELFVLTESAVGHVRVFNLSGQQVLETTGETISVVSLSPGSYVLTAVTQDGVRRGRFVKL
jgi:hypothetical protein